MSYQPDPRVPEYQQPTEQYAQAPQTPQVPAGQQAYGAVDDTVRASNLGSAHAQSQHERYIDPQGNQVESRAEVFEDKNQSRANIRYWIASVTYFVLAVLEVIMLLRFLFHLLGANQDSGFIAFLYNLSHGFVAPFNNIFNDQALGKSVFEFSTLVAMIVYALIAWGIVSLGRVIFAPNLSGQQSVTTTRRRRFQ